MRLMLWIMLITRPGLYLVLILMEHFIIIASRLTVERIGITISLGIIFYDQRKRHFGGKGITGGYIQLLSPTKIRWKLDELTGIWNETEGDESISDAERRPIGFSVPDDVIMTKE